MATKKGGSTKERKGKKQSLEKKIIYGKEIKLVMQDFISG